LSALSEWTGIQVKKSDSSRSLIVQITTATGEKQVSVEIDAVPHTQQFNGAKLLSGDFDPLLFDEIMDYALEIQDLRFLIREIQAVMAH